MDLVLAQVGVYNPVSPVGLFKLNYRMHDKYVIVDDKMYLLGGRNSNDIFLGDYTTDINVDRDILVCDTTNGKGESLQELEAYFQQIWNEGCVKIKGGRKKNSSEISVLEEAADDSEGSESNLKNSDIVNGKSNAENEITDTGKTFKVRKTIPVFRNALRFPERKIHRY